MEKEEFMRIQELSGFTNKEFAKKLGYSEITIRKIRSGELKISSKMEIIVNCYLRLLKGTTYKDFDF